MLNHTKKIKEIYEVIQKQLFYMIPEKWDKLYLYSSIIDNPKSIEKGELFFYYIPKGILRKKAVNVYEIPNKFNIDENEYFKLVDSLYSKIKELREEFKKSERKEIWSNMTLIIDGTNFKIEYDYDDLEDGSFSSYERHIIWRVKYLGITPEQCTKEEKEIIKRFVLGPKTLTRQEFYDAGIYIKNIQNIVGYSTDNYEQDTEEEEHEKDDKVNRNQILLSKEEIEKMKK